MVESNNGDSKINFEMNWKLSNRSVEKIIGLYFYWKMDQKRLNL